MSRSYTSDEAISLMQSLEPDYDFSKFKYINAKEKSIIICDKGHEYNTNLNTFKNGSRCPYCANNIKKTREEVINILKQKHPNYNFDNFEYNGANVKSLVICDKGHKFKTSYTSLVNNKGCKQCFTESTKLKHDEVIKEMKELEPNYDFSKFKYVKSNIKSIIICDKGHEYETTYSRFKEGKRCQKCYRLRCRKPEKMETIIKLFPSYDFSKFNYVNVRTKGKVICDKGHEYETTPQSLLNSNGCKICKNENQKIDKHKALEILKKIKPNYDFSKFEYKKSISLSTVICDKGHEFKTSFNRLTSKGSSCPYCVNTKSKPEFEIIEFIKGFYNKEIIHGDRTNLLNPNTGKYLEIDIYLPDLNIGFEYNGEYFHSDDNIEKRTKGQFKTKDEFHNFKTNLALNCGISLFHINETEFKDNKDTVLLNIKEEILNRSSQVY